MTLPTSCDIRATAGGTIAATVNASNMRFVVGGTEITPGAPGTFANNTTLALRFLASANVGNIGGVISCTGGSMVPQNTPNVAINSLSVSGTRVKLRWENASGTEITALPFNFGGFAETTAAVNVTSNLSSPVQAKVTGTTATFPITVALNRPTGCSIGGSAVTNANVSLYTDLGGTLVDQTGTSISALNTNLRNFQLRFLAAGNHGQQAGAVTCTSGSLVASAGGQTATLTLGAVGGSVLARPAWQDSSNTEISTIAFSFTSFAGFSAAENVDSAAVQLKLVNAARYPSSVTLTTPTGCSIGGTAVSNASVVMYTDAAGTYSELASGTLSIGSNSLRNYVLRFRSSGGHGLLAGAVTCTAGSLTFTY